MKAHVGDRIILKGTHVGDRNRTGVITDLRHDDGSPPYMVHWLEDDHDGLFFPGPDAVIEPTADARQS